MPYIVDGHNLIPRIPGIELNQIDDEIRLIEVLQEYCRVFRRQIEVYFDNAPPGGATVRRYGAVKALFVRQGRTADQAIQDRLTRLGMAARNWIVVSSDHAVQAAARTAHATVLTSDQFAREIASVSTPDDPGQSEEPALNKDELNDWLSLFGVVDDGSVCENKD